MFILKPIKSLLLIYILLCISLYCFQYKLIYHPTANVPHSHKTISVESKLHQAQSLVTNPNAKAAIIYFGGNGENVIYTADDFQTHLPDHTTYLLQYRGYSGTSGSASEENLFNDALALCDHIIKNHAEVTVIGRSLGSGVAVYLATQRTIDRLILVTPFDSIKAIAQQLLPILPIHYLLKDHYDSKSRAGQINSPTLIISAEQDEVIPAKNTLSLMRSIPPKYLKLVKSINAGHNDLDYEPNYYELIKQFIESDSL